MFKNSCPCCYNDTALSFATLAEETVSFTDSAGRTVELPKNINALLLPVP